MAQFIPTMTGIARRVMLMSGRCGRPNDTLRVPKWTLTPSCSRTWRTVSSVTRSGLTLGTEGQDQTVDDHVFLEAVFSNIEQPWRLYN